MSVKRLEFTLAEKCNSRCAHCQGSHSPEREGVMEIKDGLRYLEETVAVTRLDSFMIFGGESMLYPERTIRLFRKANELRIPEIELITNGFWGRDPKIARKLATQLREAGVTDILISVDAFHLPHIPLDGPRNAAMASVDAGIKRVRWNIAILESIDAQNKYDRRTREIAKILEPLDIEMSFNEIWPQGRARRNLKHFFPKQSLEGDCPDKKNTLVSPTCINMDPAGWASICWYMAIGNAKRTSLSKILTDYGWEKLPVTRTLVEKGPMGLIDLPECEGFNLQKEKYIDKCHLCSDLRRHVRKAYPEMYV